VSDRRATVETAYDALGDDFGAWSDRIEGDPWGRFVDELATRMPTGARVLDLGCGDGAKTAGLADRFDVVGIDVSARQLELARANVPDATFVQADYMELDYPAGTFDAITSLYSIMHAPRADHPGLLARFRRWLKPGGHLLASMSVVGGPDRFENWLGVEMFFSGFDAETNGQIVRDAGFEIVVEEVVRMQQPEGETAFLWVLARNPG
jgi:ubiquinone/menaquinone biosynthesis C-methylase UbiE